MENKIYKNIFWFGLALLLVFTPLARGTVKLWSVTPVLVLEAFLIFVWFWKLSGKKEGIDFKKQVNLPIIAFAALAVISFAFSIYKHASFYALLQLFGYIGIFYIVANEFDRQMRRRLIGLIIIIGAGLSVYGLLQYFGVFGHEWWLPKRFLAATYVNHNHFSGYLELVIPLAMGMLISRQLRNKVLKALVFAALGAMLLAFVFAQSRGAWICLITALFVMNIIMIKRKMADKSSIIILILFLAVVVAFAYLSKGAVSGRVDTIVKIQDQDASFAIRTRIWQGTADMIKARPLAGTGIGTFAWGFARFRPQNLRFVFANFAHNDYLQMAAEMGVAAPFIALWFIFLVLKRGFSKYDYSSRRFGAAVGVLSLLLHGFVDFNFHIMANALLFMVFAALIVGKKDA